MKRLMTFILTVILVLGAFSNVSAETSIRLDDEKIHLLEEYAQRIPYFEGDEVYSADFARAVIFRLFGISIGGYKSYSDNAGVCYTKSGVCTVISESDVSKEYQLIFSKAVPANTKIDGTYINYEAKCEYAPECNNREYSDKYIVSAGDWGETWCVYKNSIEDENGGLYITVDVICEGEFVGNEILHIIPYDNENGFILVSHTPYMPNSGISIEINGQKLESDQEPVMVNDRVLVPMRAIFEAFNTTVSYEKLHNSKHIINAINNNTALYLTCEETVFYNKWDINYVSRNNVSEYRKVDFDVSPLIINGRTMVPVRVIAETLGTNVTWDGNTKTVIISGDIPSKWSRAGDIEKMNGLSYQDLFDIVKGYCDKNNISIKDAYTFWDFEHGKGIQVKYGYSESMVYYYDGYIERQ